MLQAQRLIAVCLQMAAFTLVAAACGRPSATPPTAQTLNNGAIVTGASSVVRINGRDGSYCSAVIISKEQQNGVATLRVLTAGHCAFDNQRQPFVASQLSLETNGGEYAGVAIRVHPAFVAQTSSPRSADLAIMLFRRATLQTPQPVAALARTAPKVSDPITIEGFGQQLREEVEDGHRHRGANTINSLARGLINFQGPAVALSTTATVSQPGDSGGAVFNAKGELIGIIVSGRQTDADGSASDIVVDPDGSVHLVGGRTKFSSAVDLSQPGLLEAVGLR